jgi:hypothetical protein
MSDSLTVEKELTPVPGSTPTNAYVDAQGENQGENQGKTQEEKGIQPSSQPSSQPSKDIPLSPNIVALLEALKTTIGDNGLTFNNILEVCIELMKIAQTWNIPGLQKKQAVIDAVTVFIKSNQYDELLLQIIPSFIDLAVSLHKGNVSLDELVNLTKGCFSLCFSKCGKGKK